MNLNLVTQRVRSEAEMKKGFHTLALLGLLSLALASCSGGRSGDPFGQTGRGMGALGAGGGTIGAGGRMAAVLTIGGQRGSQYGTSDVHQGGAGTGTSSVHGAPPQAAPSDPSAPWGGPSTSPVPSTPEVGNSSSIRGRVGTLQIISVVNQQLGSNAIFGSAPSGSPIGAYATSVRYSIDGVRNNGLRPSQVAARTTGFVTTTPDRSGLWDISVTPSGAPLGAPQFIELGNGMQPSAVDCAINSTEGEVCIVGLMNGMVAILRGDFRYPNGAIGLSLHDEAFPVLRNTSEAILDVKFVGPGNEWVAILSSNMQAATLPGELTFCHFESMVSRSRSYPGMISGAGRYGDGCEPMDRRLLLGSEYGNISPGFAPTQSLMGRPIKLASNGSSIAIIDSRLGPAVGDLDPSRSMGLGIRNFEYLNFREVRGAPQNFLQNNYKDIAFHPSQKTVFVLNDKVFEVRNIRDGNIRSFRFKRTGSMVAMDVDPGTDPSLGGQDSAFLLIASTSGVGGGGEILVGKINTSINDRGFSFDPNGNTAYITGTPIDIAIAPGQVIPQYVAPPRNRGEDDAAAE